MDYLILALLALILGGQAEPGWRQNVWYIAAAVGLAKHVFL